VNSGFMQEFPKLIQRSFGRRLLFSRHKSIAPEFLLMALRSNNFFNGLIAPEFPRTFRCCGGESGRCLSAGFIYLSGFQF
jgi:hypothetical protein